MLWFAPRWGIDYLEVTMGRVSTIFAAALLLGFFPGRAVAKEKALMLSQYSGLYGKQTLIVTKSMVHHVRHKKFVTLCFNALNNQVTIYNTEVKNYYQLSLKSFVDEETSRMVMLDGYLRDLPLIEDADDKSNIAGLKTRNYKLKPGSRVNTGRIDSDKVMSLAGADLKAARLWTTKDFALEPSTQKALNVLYHFPPFKGIPLKMSLTKSDGKSIKELETLQTREIDMDPAFLKQPPGYKKAPNYTAVLHQEEGSVKNLMKYFDAFQTSGLGN